LGADGDKYSTIKETLTVKTNKDGSVTGTYNKTETFTRAGKFTATGATVGDIENFSNVTLDGSTVEDISNFTMAKVVTKGTASWDNMSAYGRPADYDIDLAGWELTEIETESLNGSVTLKNGASASSITNFKSLTMTASTAGTIENVSKITIKKGDNVIISAPIIPNPTNAANRHIMERRLKLKGARIYPNAHVSGHAGREDHREFLRMLKPQHIIPAHGDLSMLAAYAELAEEEGYSILILGVQPWNFWIFRTCLMESSTNF
jgi:hypothetical protein